MNYERLLAIADYIEKHPQEYDQGTYGEITPCGTVACVAGTAMLLFAKDEIIWRKDILEDFLNLGSKRGSVWVHAKTLLGLSNIEAHLLFSGLGVNNIYKSSNPSAEHAAKCIRDYVAKRKALIAANKEENKNG